MPLYDRNFLLSEDKRNEILSLDEVRSYGRDSFGDPDYVCLYGHTPEAWYALGVRVLARTAVECTRDRLADLIGRDVAEVARTAKARGHVVVDPFAGSANTLHWIQRRLAAERGVGFELDDAVFALTAENLAIVNLGVDLVHSDYEAGLADLDVPPECLLVVFTAPPWGDALAATRGLDLRATCPPVGESVDAVSSMFPEHHLLFAVQLYERLDEASLSELSARFDWSTSRMYDVDSPGRNHGLLLGTTRWRPED